jgi:hypothetical protein
MLLLALPIGRVSAGPNADDLVRESVARLGLQTELPGPTSELRTDAKPGAQTEMPAPRDEVATVRVAPEFVRYALWVIVIVGVLVLVWSLRDSLPVMSRPRKIVAPEQPAASPAQSNRLEEAQVEADDLARQGHYAEAMHLLLLKSLSELRRQLGTSFAISLTSREILWRVKLPDIGRQSLTTIIASVERTYFGGEDAGQDDYSHCRSNFEALKRSLAPVAVT